MSPCCIAAAAATAVLTALIVVGLTGFVLITDGFGLGIALSTLLAAVLQRLGLIGPCPRLLYVFSALLAVRALWLLATSRRALVVAAWKLVRANVSRAVLRLKPAGQPRRVRFHRHQCAEHGHHANDVHRIGTSAD